MAAGSCATARTSKSRQASAWPRPRGWRPANRFRRPGQGHNSARRRRAGPAVAAGRRAGGQVARTRRQQRDAGGDAFDVGHLRQAWRPGAPPASLCASAAMASWRARATLWSRRAWCSQWRSMREPMAVRQWSSSENRVGRFLAADGFGQFQVAAGGRVQADEFAFRFRRQASARAAGRGPASTAHSAAARRPRRTRRRRPSAPKPVRVATPNWSSRALWPPTTSKCQSGTRLMCVPA